MKRNAQIWWPLTQVSVLLSPVLIVLGVVVAGASSSYLEPYWLDVASKSITSIIFIAPAFAAMSAWDASRWRHLAIASVRSPAGLLLRHVVWVATATSIIFGVTHLYLLTEVGTPVGKPTVGIILMAVWATTGYAAVGFLLGWFVPRLVAVPIAFAGTWFWVAYTPAIQPFWLRNVTGNLGTSCCALNQELLPVGLWAPVIATGALLLASALVLSVVEARVEVVAVVCVLAAAIVGVGFTGARGLVRDLGADPVTDRTSRQVCVSDKEQTWCTWPEKQIKLDRSKAVLTDAANQLRAAGLDVPRRLGEGILTDGWEFYADPDSPEEMRRILAGSSIATLYPACMNDDDATASEASESEPLVLAWLEVKAGNEENVALEYHDMQPQDLRELLERPAAEQLAWYRSMHEALNTCGHIE